MDIQMTVLDSLDDLTSTRSSLNRRSRALNTLEKLLAELCVSREPLKIQEFLALQNGFEGNVASRLLTSLAICLPALQQLVSSQDEEPTSVSECITLTQHAQQSLSILQGVALIHIESKLFLGRKSSIHILLDLLSVSRHTPSDSSIFTASITSDEPGSPKKASSPPAAPTLTSSVLDTLLCILVDSPVAMRVFEDASGVEGVVKTLKKAGVAREVRMKCLEFLYFYLLPEDGSTPALARCASSPTRAPLVDHSLTYSMLNSPSKSLPGSPISPLKPELAVSSMEPGPSAVTSLRQQKSETPSTPKRHRATASTPNIVIPSTPKTKPANLNLLNQEIDYEPLSPKKSQVASLGVGTPGKRRSAIRDAPSRKTTDEEIPPVPRLIFPSFAPSTPSRKRTPLAKPAEVLRRDKLSEPSPKSDPRQSKSRLPNKTNGEILRSGSEFVLEEATNRVLSRAPTPPSPLKTSSFIDATGWPSSIPTSQRYKPRIRSTEEKKELLGNWLGNVDALVEGVQLAGVWGLA